MFFSSVMALGRKYPIFYVLRVAFKCYIENLIKLDDLLNATSLYDREFVNSVWCIKILSPEEVQQMGNTGLGLLNSVPIQRLSSSICDDYVSRQDPRNLSSGITTVGSLDY